MRRLVLCVLMFVAVLAQLSAQAPRSAASAAWWPHWRGPALTGVAPGDAPVQWSDTSNIAWKVEIPGRGHSSPVIWGDRIFLTTAIPTGRRSEPAATGGRGGRGRFGGDGGSGANEEHRFDVIALERATGRVLWQKTALTATPHEGYHQMYGSFASYSPTTDGQRVYVSFGSRGLFAYDMNGTPVWQKDYGLKMRMFNGFGEGVEPVLDEGHLIVLYDHEDEGLLAMLDAATGREIWRTPRTDGTNWAAPVVVTHGGKKQIVDRSRRKHILKEGLIRYRVNRRTSSTICVQRLCGLIPGLSGFRISDIIRLHDVTSSEQMSAKTTDIGRLNIDPLRKLTTVGKVPLIVDR